MPPSFTTLLERSKKNGSLAIGANLLFDIVLLGWLAFAGLYSIEVLLPTFVTARLSLVKFSVILIGLTALLAVTGKSLPHTSRITERAPHIHRWLFFVTIAFILGILTLAHYRFPWWTIPISVGSYAATSYVFWKNYRSEKLSQQD
ncbi:MAG: hypothetical protein ACEQSB_03335 [Undibacterium sp.]